MIREAPVRKDLLSLWLWMAQRRLIPFRASWRRLLAGRLRERFRQASLQKDASARQRSLEELNHLRKLLHPAGQTHLARAALEPGLRLWVNLAEKVGGDLYYGGRFEPASLHVVRRLVEPGDVFLDIGAHVGFYTLTASRLVGPGGRVHAFEPLREAFDLLERNLRLNAAKNVMSNCVAVGDLAGEAELSVNQESALSSLVATGRGKVLGTRKVPVVTLDDYAEGCGIAAADFLKIDVEGFEGHVLRGGRRLIDRSPGLAILCELSEKNYSPASLDITQVFHWLEQRGFGMWEIPDNAEIPRKLTSPQDRRAANNFLFLRPGSPKERLVPQKAAEYEGAVEAP